MGGHLRQKGERLAMSGSANQNSNKDCALAKQLVAGTQKYFSSVPQLTFGDGSIFTPAQVEAQLLALATLRTDVNDAKTVMEAKLSAERAKAPALLVFMREYVSFVMGTFGKSPETLAAFGLKPKKAPKPLTADQLAAKAAKAKATRKARGTVGKKKKLAIQGDVAGLVNAPITVTLNTPELAPAATPATSTTPTNGAALKQ
jgi:hypothetical protein